MDNSFHYLLMANQSMVQKCLFCILKGSELTLGQPKVLDYLSEHNGSSQKEIALGCRIEAASLTSVLNRMEEKGMIERRMLNGNRRTFYIFLTEKGEALQGLVEQSFKQIEEEIFDGISEEEKESFMNTMSKIYEKLNKKGEI